MARLWALKKQLVGRDDVPYPEHNPYRRVGKTILHKKNGWTKKQTARSVVKAKRAMRLLQGIEHGWKPTGAKAINLRSGKRKKR